MFVCAPSAQRVARPCIFARAGSDAADAAFCPFRTHRVGYGFVVRALRKLREGRGTQLCRSCRQDQKAWATRHTVAANEVNPTLGKTMSHLQKKSRLVKGGFLLSFRPLSKPHGITVKLVEAVAVPPGVVMAIFPVFAPVGTSAVTVVSESTVTSVAFTPSKVTSVV